mmetsp:Transcript_14233/g.21715  ORF Transcript_14233/g.21715 Transcript_14233/m.21715 type:complete len:142 (+) Transcript_14233:164-589(+)
MLNLRGIPIYILLGASFSSAFTFTHHIKFSPTLLDASLRPIEGGDEIVIPAGGTADLGDGCTVADIKGKYFCTAEKDGTTFIGDSSLSSGVNYLLSNGMKLRISGEREFDVLIDEQPQSDPMMKMMFEAMKAGFSSDSKES